MKFIKTNSEVICAEVLARKLVEFLSLDKKVLWLVPGGSNISIAVSAMQLVRQNVTEKQLEKLAITLTDERYGAVGHTDSNWQQLIDAGFNFEGLRAVPVLVDKPLQETKEQYAQILTELFSWADKSVGQFGIGTDGHIAGVLPHTLGTTETNAVVAYEAGSFLRLTITLKSIRKLSVAYALVFGSTKKTAIQHLQKDNLSLEEEPSAILKFIPEAYLYSDQVE